MSCLSVGKSADVIVKGIQYTGPLVGKEKGVIAVLDPFEVNFIASHFISVSSSGDHKINCENPIPTFHSILKSLKGRPVLLQVDSTFLQGIVQHVSKHKNQVQLLNNKTTSTIRLQDLVVVLVPLLLATQVSFGDPQYQLTLINEAPATAHVTVFQPPV